MRRPGFLRLGTGMVGFAMLVAIVAIAVFGPLVAPHAPQESLTTPGATPGDGLALGADQLGRDVLSRLLHGGRTALGYALLATILAYVVALPIGLAAGYLRSFVEPLLMRGVDVIRAFPPLLLFLIVVTAAGTNPLVLILGVAATQVPAVARLAYTVTLETSLKGYVEAAEARGERAAAIVRREVLPNIMPALIADVGLRLSLSILLIAAMNFLGLGLQPPASDWALMISENRQIIALNAFAVFAPAALLALLAVSVNLVGDAVARTLGRSTLAAPARRSRVPLWRRAARPDTLRPVAQLDDSQALADDNQLLLARNLRVELESGEPVVEDATLTLKPGEVLGLVGESGSGKTTAALALLGYARPGMRIAGGMVTIDGQRLPFGDERALRRLRGSVVSYVPQDPADSLNPALRIGAALRDIVRSNGSKAPGNDDIGGVLSRVRLPDTDDFARRYPHQLSGGQQQRVCIAAALVAEPPLVVLDEPTTGLDVVTQSHILAEIKRVHRERGVSMVYVSHDLAAVAQVADRIAVMYAGRVVEEAPAAELLRRPQHPYTRGLIASVPSHVTPRRLQAMPGVAVGVRERPTGCAFAPRCPQRREHCDSAQPALDQIARDRMVACFEHHRTPPVVVGETIVPRQVAGAAPLLVVDGLRAVHRGRGETVIAADDVSFVVNPSECVALVGESGSGKTTIARCVAGLHIPEAGTIELGGERLAARAADRALASRRRCQIVFQNPFDSLNPRRTVGEEVARPARMLRRLTARDADAEVDRLLELVRLPARLRDSHPRELSGGERQRVAIARALAADPNLLICDEITSALDVSVQAAVIDLLSDLRAQLDMSLLFITHDLGVVASLADRVLVLDQGRICEQGAVLDVLANPGSERARELIDSAPVLDVWAVGPSPTSNVT